MMVLPYQDKNVKDAVLSLQIEINNYLKLFD